MHTLQNPTAQAQPLRLLRMGDVIDRVALSKSEIHNRIRAGEFPRPVHLGPQSTRFLEHEVQSYLEGVIARCRADATN